MAAAIIKERYYILTPLSFLLGVLVLITTLLLAPATSLRSIDKTTPGYDHMLTSIDATLIHEMVLANRRQLGVLEASLDKRAIARGGSAINPIWAIAHQVKHDAHFLSFYNTRAEVPLNFDGKWWWCANWGNVGARSGTFTIDGVVATTTVIDQHNGGFDCYVQVP